MRKLRTLVMLILFSAAGLLEAFRLSSLSSLANCDIWWHLSSGLWMLRNHAFPHSGIFSQASAQAWNASSWGYELLLALTYRLFGLRSIPLFLMWFRCALAVLTFLLVGGARGKFWPAVGLSAIAQYVLGSIPPGPGCVSVLFFGIELLLLLEARRSGSSRVLWWLVPLFAAWANLHMQFVYGVAALVLFLGAMAVEKPVELRTLSAVSAGKIVGVCVAATMLTPNLWGGYTAFFRTIFNPGNKYLPDFQALGFRQPQDYLLMMLAMAAFLALGLLRSRDWFQIAVLAGCLVLSFYARRDVWLVALSALAVIGDALAREPIEPSVDGEADFERRELVAVAQAVPVVNNSVPQRLKPRSLSDPYGTTETRALPETIVSSNSYATIITAGIAMLLVLVFFALRVPSSREILLAKARQSYPVAACDYIRSHQLAQPLFNAYEWGGFLTWYLPEYAVAIDSRTDLYGGDAITAYSKVMSAEVRYTDYSALAEAQTILLPKSAIMASALSSVPLFKVAYSDDVAVVLSRRSTNE